MLIPYIEEKAEKILNDFNISSAPIDVFSVAENLNVSVQAANLEDEVSGLYVLKGNASYIMFNETEGQPRQRFTVAHELGHFLLHSKDNNFFIDKFQTTLYRNAESSSGAKLKEREANAFAAALLMPKKLILEVVNGMGANNTEEDFVDKLSKIFNVSEQAMTIRLSNLGLLEFGLF